MTKALLITAFGLSGCIYSDENEPPRLLLTLHLPVSAMIPYEPSGRSVMFDIYATRCVIEGYNSTDGAKAFRHIARLTADAEGNCSQIELNAAEGVYDLLIWCDHTDINQPYRDLHYNTDNLHTVTVMPDDYTGNITSKFASCTSVNNVMLNCARTTTEEAYLNSPLARYRIISTDVEAYARMTELHPDKYPSIEELTVEVHYEFFIISSFNVATYRPNDSATGISYTFHPCPAEGSVITSTVMLGGDMIFASDSDSSVTLTIEIKDKSGQIISRASGLKIAYRQGYETTVTGNFLTLGVAAGGINIDTSWREDIIIHF